MVLNNRNKIAEFSRRVKEKCISYIGSDNDGQKVIVDPIDKKTIPAHYADSHIAAGLILSGIRNKDENEVLIGINLLNGLLSRLEKNRCLQDFHFDFNNFALCLIYETLAFNGYYKKYENLLELIKKIVLSTKDSDHDTINWLPMRIYVNKNRFKWTNNYKYIEICSKLYNKIEQAKFDDGFIDDRLPKGTSYNFQYNIATVSLLQFLNCRGEQNKIGKNFGALLSIIAPDGDINYLGRGTNQIFAWGLWVYLLASSRNEDRLKESLEYLDNYLDMMLVKNNLMLNDFPGKEKYFWWSYHYVSVYVGHFFLWLELALADYGKNDIISDCNINENDSKIKIFRSDRYFLALNGGRKEYLSEAGPAIAALWTKKNGMIFKGCFGPWVGTFGDFYQIPGIVLRNFIGIIKVKQDTLVSICKLKNIFLNKKKRNYKEELMPLFSNIIIEDNGLEIKIIFRNDFYSSAIFNLPVFITSSFDNNCFSLKADGSNIELIPSMYIRNYFNWCKIYQSRKIIAKEWILSIKYF